MTETSGSTPISTKQQQIAELARKAPEMAFTTLAHHMDMDWMREAYRRTRKDGAAGVDGQTAEEYAKDLAQNLAPLLERAKSGTYRAPPVRRVHIPKGDGSQTRPLGIPTFEDKILQTAVLMLLEPVYEQDFYDCSYGFRPGRSAHQALQELWERTMAMHGGWILEVDIRKFFDTLDKTCLREILAGRVCDGVVARLVGKWLNAGVLEDGSVSYPEAGTPQGGVISPLLANVYLHEVLDKWFETVVKPHLKGSAFLIRYADDFVIGFALEEDARRIMAVLPKRFGKYGLALHPEKTRLVPFRRPRLSGGREPPGGMSAPGSFDLLGFTHFWGLSRKGAWVVKRKTAKSRFNRGLKQISAWLRIVRHYAVDSQWKSLCMKLKGHFGYYGITGNSASLSRFRHAVLVLWKKWLGRRSQRSKTSWEWFMLLLKRYPLPSPIAVHSLLRQAAKP
jgi:RNA-directed DNA polymerase